MQSPLGTPPPCPTHQFETPSPLDPVHPAPGHQRSHPRYPGLSLKRRVAMETGRPSPDGESALREVVEGVDVSSVVRRG